MNTVLTVRKERMAAEAVALILAGRVVEVLNRTALPNPPTGP